MAKLQSFCPTCGKKAKEKSHLIDEFLGIRITTLECNHSLIEQIIARQPWEELETREGHTLFPYQGEGYEFARKSNFRCLIADEQGLGKTIQGLACLKLHAEELLPCLIVVKSSLIYQWLDKIIKWCGPEFLPNIIKNSKDRPDPNYPITIVTYDILNRITKAENKKREDAEIALRAKLGYDEWTPLSPEEDSSLPEVKNPFVEFGFKSVILDECQQIKNPNSKRTNEVRNLCKNIPHIIAMSGTPIKNNAGEYFPILNILDPKNFHTYKSFVENYCDYYSTPYGYKVGGIRDLEYFDALTRDYIIRRVRTDVFKDLPTLNRKFIHCDFASKKIEDDYREMQEDFEDYFNEGDRGNTKEFYANILEKINKLRHKVGINKVPFCVEFITDFILDTNRKIVIFVHHHDVMFGLERGLISELQKIRAEGGTANNPLVYSADLSPEKRNEVVQKFKDDPNNRILIASTLAAGEGINLQFCSDCIFLERQWNPAGEEQGEGRFVRIGSTCQNCGKEQSSGQQESPKCAYCGFELKVDAYYIITTGTIDEYFTEIVEFKRGITSSTLDKKVLKWNEEGLLKELIDVLSKKGMRRWRL